MDPNKAEISRLEVLPQDLLGEIVAKIGAKFAENYHNCILSCKELGASANDELVLKTLNLAPLVKKPLSCRKHLLIMKKCLANNNPDAHYIKGIIWYFNLDHCDVGLHHIGIAANGGQKEAIYMYAMLLLCRRRTEEGKTYMSQLEWAKDTTMAETCWKQIKTSLNGIRVARKRCYMISLRNMKPPDVCHPRDLDNTCEKCFFYKQMFKFIFMV
ncbi:unnamed protein product [Arabidopsis thaliana]|uniref:At2g35280-like TPR domain-containing protein n=1 Tax=Arabidopsis thaliana TaxID=3702 RepID=A0A654FI43_ARATH|nr:unnamed protein product [Arabidopsis thaliana]